MKLAYRYVQIARVIVVIILTLVSITLTLFSYWKLP